jgi:cystathionine beta-lyase family protein involved in aluminum resistance
MLGDYFLALITFFVYVLTSILLSNKFIKLHAKMPLVWQDMTETIQIGASCGYKIKAFDDVEAIAELYEVIHIHETLFEVKINRKILCEISYGFEEQIENYKPCEVDHFLIMYAITCYALLINIGDQKNIDKIQKAILVRKRPSGKRKSSSNLNHANLAYS